GNGSGKSPLVRLLSGTESPSRGRVRRSVRVSWPRGFRLLPPQLTGREHLRFVADTYGEATAAATDFVEDCAELGDYLNLPVKSYSSGMGARLAFALSLAIDFDVYLIDELTAVGDKRFQERCREMFARRREVSDVIMVSHNFGTIREYC